ncbi:MAG: inositol monophosphatase family protein [Patescibacteria group bacterium]
MDNIENPKGIPNNLESKEYLEGLVIAALERALGIHDNLGVSGEETVEKNQFGDTALRVDVECEEAVLNFLKEKNFPIRVISEEHGTVDISSNPRYLGILDGLDGSGVYKKERGVGRYGTMFAIFSNTNPVYGDYATSGIMEHTSKRLFFATKGGGAFIKEAGKTVPIHSSGKKTVGAETRAGIDEYFEINRRVFSEKLKGIQTNFGGASCIYYADVACGRADLALECTRKNNLEIAVAYGLISEAGGVIVDLSGETIGDKKYLEFGQEDKLPIVTAATRELALSLISHIK